MYNGVIKKSRSLDLAAISGALDAIVLIFLSYKPEQLGLTVPLYAVARMVLTVAQFYLRFKTTGPVGEKS